MTTPIDRGEGEVTAASPPYPSPVASRIERVGLATLYLGDCRAILDILPDFDVGVFDPPYGIGYTISARSLRNEGLDSLAPMAMGKRGAIAGDDAPFDPSPFIAAFPKVAIFGANYMAGLPRGKWICWDKRRDSKPDDHSDCEFIWLSERGADRIHRQKWRGIVREGEENCSRSKKLHPNQKPVALLGYLFDQLGVEVGETVCDPFMGSGSTGVVAMRRGHPFVGIESDPAHFDTAVRRLSAEHANTSDAAVATEEQGLGHTEQPK